jgi:hypothetical protein
MNDLGNIKRMNADETNDTQNERWLKHKRINKFIWNTLHPGKRIE